MSMFCYQCEQTAGGSGCTRMGVCGKDETTAKLQDVLLFLAKGISQYAHRALERGARDEEIERFVIEALFTTVTNVNFDPARLEARIQEAVRVREKARKLYESACADKGESAESPAGPATWTPPEAREGLLAHADTIGLDRRKAAHGDTVTGLEELYTYGLKGAAAYFDHARVLGHADPALAARFLEALSWLGDNGQHTVEECLPRCLDAGDINLKSMELLDAANTGAYGHPAPTAVRVTPVAGKCILVSGHDLRDLKKLLVQTEGKGINIYTHGEMLPAHGYPELKKHKHLVGNFGGAWQDQRKEFPDFPGAILFTTNCIQKPTEDYKDRTFTTGLVAWPDVAHIGEDKDFSPVIEAALAQPGFSEGAPEKTITVGFGRNAILGAAEKVIDLVKGGRIRHFFLVGGCDGAKSGRNYYTEFVENVPDDCVVLTLACGKYRFNKMDLGDIGGIPRLLDVGQCNDAYSAIVVAKALSEAFGCGVNDLPLSMVLSWYEQKAVAILLTLLNLGVTDIRLGPSLPAFVTPDVLQVLVDQYGIKPVDTPEADLATILE